MNVQCMLKVQNRYLKKLLEHYGNNDRRVFDDKGFFLNMEEMGFKYVYNLNMQPRSL